MPADSSEGALWRMGDEGRGERFSSASTKSLLEEIREGNDRALEALYERYLPRLKRWARGRLPGHARHKVDTDDIVQQTLTNVLNKVQRFEQRHAGAFQGYVRRGVLNQIRDQIRQAEKLRKTDGSLSAIASQEASPIELAVGSETLESYERSLEQVSPRDRSLIIARIEMGFDHAEIAREFEMKSPDAARMATSRALIRLAERMGATGRR